MSPRPALFLCLLLISLPLTASADEPAVWRIASTGVRIGADLGDVIGLNLGEAYMTVGSPWRWRPLGALQLDFVAEAAAGIISGGSEKGGVFKAGPGITARWGTLPVTLKGTLSPTLLTRSEYDGFELGGHIHFTTAADLIWNVTPRWSVGYHIQHTSNANLDFPNPGADLHAVDFAFHF